jgi:hypothetical protein
MFHLWDSLQSFGVLMFNFSFVDRVDIFACVCGINIWLIHLSSLFLPNAECLLSFSHFFLVK